MTNIFQGDPRIFIDENGADLKFIGGQPIMDGGVENLAVISLFTEPGWAGNDLFRNSDQIIGSSFQSAASQTITQSSLNRIRDAAEKALKNPAFGEVTVTVTNPTGYQIHVSALIKPPGSDAKELSLTKNGLNWQIQAVSPASSRI